MTGQPAPTQVIPFVVHLPLQDEAGLERLVQLQSTPGSQAYHHWITPAQFSASYGAPASKMKAVVAALRSEGMTVDAASSQIVTARATVAQLQRSFNAKMATFQEADGRTHVASVSALTLPAAMTGSGATVEGVVYHGAPHPMFHRGAAVDTAAVRPTAPARTRPTTPSSPRSGGATPNNRYGLFGPLWFDDTKQAYRYPSNQIASGKGVVVATVNEGDFSSADLATYLQHEKIGNASGDLAPLPNVSHFLVPGAPAFDPNSGASFEANLDTQQVAGMAPGATLIGYTTNAFNFPSDFIQVYDYINQTNSADVVSTSYGECENVFIPSYNGGQDYTGTLRALHDEFLQGNSEGITYTVSSGDEAGLPCPEIAYFTNPNAKKNYVNVPSVDIPASDPNVISVGGGNLITSYDPSNAKDLNSTYITENAYGDPETPSDRFGFGNTLTNNYWGAGTGQSVVFSKPTWQRGITPGTTRSVPDVGGFVGGCFDGDPLFVQPCHNDVSHALTTLSGTTYEVIGTSVAAPQFAALLADVEQLYGSGSKPGAGRLGNVNPTLYGAATSYYHDGIPGFDGIQSFGGQSGAKWLPSYGLGSLYNQQLGYYPGTTAGVPQTPSNP